MPMDECGHSWRGWRFLAQVLLLLSMAGCVVVPGFNLPGPGHLEPASIGALQVGRSSRVEVLMTLGDPDRRYLDDRIFGYQWQELVAALLYGQQLAGEIDLTRQRLLLIEFDAKGLVRRADVVEGIAKDALDEAVDEWMAGVTVE